MLLRSSPSKAQATAQPHTATHSHKAAHLGAQGLGLCLQLRALLAGRLVGSLPCVRGGAQVRWGEEGMRQSLHPKGQHSDHGTVTMAQ